MFIGFDYGTSNCAVAVMEQGSPRLLNLGASRYLPSTLHAPHRDAIAGLLILFINLIGGMAVGIFQHGMSFSEAGKVYALLTIGDGLVAQLPSLLLSTAAAIMVTRASGSEDMGKQINRQMFASPKALAVAAGIMAIMGIVPGMPHFSFLTMAALTLIVSFLTRLLDRKSPS